MGEEKKKKKKHSFKFGCITLSLSHFLVMGLTAGAMLLYWYVPAYVGSLLLPQIASVAGLKGISGTFDNLGVSGAEYNNVRLEMDGRRIISADSIRIDYQLPFWPFKREVRINSIALFGARVRMIKDGEQWKIPGIYPDLMQKGNEKLPQPSKSSKSRSWVAMDLQTIELNRCSLLVELKPDRVLEFPISLKIKNPDNWNGQISANLRLQCAGDNIRGRLDWDRQRGNLSLKLRGQLSPDNYFEEGNRPVTGKAVFSGEFFGRFPVGGLHRIDGNFKIVKLQLNASGWTLGLNGKDQPAELRFKQTTDDRTEYSIAGLVLNGPVKMSWGKAAGQIVRKDGKINLTGEGRGWCTTGSKPGILLPADLPVTHKLEINWDMTGQQGKWNYAGNIAAPEKQTAAVITDSGTLLPGELKINSEGKIFRIRQNGPFGFDSKTTLEAGPEVIWETRGKDKQPGPRAAIVKRPKVEITVEKQDNDLRGGFRITALGMSFPSAKIETSTLEAEMPLLTLVKAGKKGRIRVNDILWNRHPVMDVDLAAEGTATGLNLDGMLVQKILPGAPWHLTLTTQLLPVVKGTFGLDFGPYDLTSPLEPGKYFPKLEGMSLGGNIEGHVRFDFGPTGKSGSAAFKLRNGTFTNSLQGVKADGLAMALDLPDLPDLRTPPLQTLSCSSLQAGTIGLKNLNAQYQLEKGFAFLLENFSADWCGGKVHTESLRITPGQRNIRAVVYCNGLELPLLLNQMGIAKAVGSGRIHGRLPLNIGQDGIVLEPGFLYSEPGETHSLSLSGMEKMLEGIPPESMQYSQLDIASEALKDFNYEWVRINFASAGENLRLEMQINGRPVQPLPFSYDSNKGGFIRVKGQKAIFQGIRLDVNSNLPMNRLLKFNNNIKQLLGGKK